MCSNGPWGKPSSRIAPSISSIVAVPPSSNRNASRVNGRLMRLTTKPGESAHRIGVLPQRVTTASARIAVPASVS